MASIHILNNAWLGERGVVVIDSDQSMVRLVRKPAAGEADTRTELAGPVAQDILMGFLRVTGRE